MKNHNIWQIQHIGEGPIVATAIHNGHLLRDEVASLSALSDEARLREEDPFTGDWTSIANVQVVVHNSRFEVDLNRPRHKAVYIHPEDAWGLKVWTKEPSIKIIVNSLGVYDSFYEEIYKLFSQLEKRYDSFVVFDLHSYNYRRNGPQSPPEDPQLNPEVNIGTGTMDRKFWSPIVTRFISDLKNYNCQGRKLDVRENVKFKGGQFSRWIHENFPESACALAIEFKKFFMDEWSGTPDLIQLNEIRLALSSTIPGVLEELAKMR